MNNLQFRLLQTESPAYEEMVTLRMEVLLNPIGIPRSYIDPEKEAGDLLIGAYTGRQLIGCCILSPVSDTTVQLRQMAVAASMQKKGVGAAILRFAEEKASQKGYRILIMHARDTVLPFYQKCGYEVAGKAFFEVGISHHKMKKELLPGR